MDRPNAHPAHIAPAGTWRIFAEDETGGEAYIPLRNDWRRPRAVAIWEETGRLLGLQWQRMAAGALWNTSAMSHAAPSVSVTAPQIDYTQLAAAMARAGLGVNIGSITSHDTRGVMAAFDRRLQTALTMLHAVG